MTAVAWRRFVARLVDMAVFVAPLRPVVHAIFPATSFEPWALLTGAVGSFGWVFVEAALLALSGMTPGKWMLHLAVSGGGGAPPSFGAALHRSFTVWWRGTGCWIPVVALVPMAVSYRQLLSRGRTAWDEQEALTVSHGELTPGRIVAGVAVVFALGAVSTWLQFPGA
jgi:uncharacterized RDD family membrane protein YckC